MKPKQIQPSTHTASSRSLPSDTIDMHTDHAFARSGSTEKSLDKAHSATMNADDACTDDTVEEYMQSGGLQTVVKPPSSVADIDTKMHFINYQLDCLGVGAEVLEGLVLLGGGAQERPEGGVQLTHFLNAAPNK